MKRDGRRVFGISVDGYSSRGRSRSECGNEGESGRKNMLCQLPRSVRQGQEDENEMMDDQRIENYNSI